MREFLAAAKVQALFSLNFKERVNDAEGNAPEAHLDRGVSAGVRRLRFNSIQQ